MKQTVTEMKVLNIAQPNAHNVIFNGKNVENRNMPSCFRGTIAIYASKTYNKSRFEKQQVDKTSINKEDCSFGCIIGFVDIVDCITEDELKKHTKDWFKGPYGYVFENVIALKEPIEVSPPQGAVVWWTLSGKLLEACVNQIPPFTKIAPISIADAKAEIKKAKNGSSTRLIPSEALAEIIGSSPITYKQSVNKFSDYLEENELFEDHNGTTIVKADKKLKLIFCKNILHLNEIVEFIKKNLHE